MLTTLLYRQPHLAQSTEFETSSDLNSQMMLNNHDFLTLRNIHHVSQKCAAATYILPQFFPDAIFFVVLLSLQHLFMSFPRIIFMLGFLVFVFFLLGGYALFHSYLALVNQTSNEWYKSRGYFCQHCHPASAVDPLKTPVPEHSKRYFYSHGILRNLGEIFFPPRLPKRKVN